MATKLARPRKKEPPRMRAVREAMGVPRRTFSRLMGFSERAVAAWESGAQAPNELAERRLRELERLREALAAVVRAEAIPGWLITPNAAFGGLKPLEVIERGETDRLWRMIHFLEAGVAS